MDRSNSEVVEPKMTVGLAGGDLRSEYGAAAPPESCPRIAEDSGLQRSRRLHAVGDGRTCGLLSCRRVTADTAPLVKYLKADLQRIVDSANEELKSIRRAGLADSTRQAEEARVINDARAFAVRRVESTVRHLRNMKPKLPAEHRSVNGADDTEKTRRFKARPVRDRTRTSPRTGPRHQAGVPRIRPP